jgi:flavin-dependent dehydrogenase
MGERFDAVIVGASIAGCTAAVFLARRGARVALLDRASDPRAYKKTCTHYIQPCATGTIERLGLAPLLERAGVVRGGADACSSHGWIRDPQIHFGHSIRREVLDPMLRELASKTDGVTLRLGHAVRELKKKEGRPCGVVAEAGEGGARVEIDSTLVVGADGRHGKIADQAGFATEHAPNNRFIYLAYYQIADSPSQRATIWWRDPPDAAYVFPNDSGVTCVAVMPRKEWVPAFRRDLEGSFLRSFEGLPEAPDLARAERVSDFMGMIEIPNHIRRAGAPGIALVGDAAMTSDPLLGVGCGWAFQTGEWLAEDVGDALVSGRGLDEALETYAKHHQHRLRAHHGLTNKLALAEPFDLMNRTFFHAGACDPAVARSIALLNGRVSHPREILTLGLLARSFWARAFRKPAEPATLQPLHLS